jgi:hypothetical protein
MTVAQNDAAWTLSSDDWLPAACRPHEVMAGILAEDTSLCAGRIGRSGQLEASNVVERLATAFGVLRKQQDRLGRLPSTTLMWETLERLGGEVSPEFAEAGSDALTVMEVSKHLLEGKALDTFAMARAFGSLGRLWAGAFSAPSGMDLWVANSAALVARPESRFFLRLPETLPSGPLALGQYLCRHVDLLQAAVATNDLPDRVIDRPVSFGQWRGPVGRLMDVSEDKRILDVHRRVEPVAHNVERITVKLVERASGAPLAATRLVRLVGKTGYHPELLALSEVAGATTQRMMEAAFGSDDLVGMSPRVARIMNDMDQMVYEVGVIEAMHVTPYWRGSNLGEVVFRQALADCLNLGLVLAQAQPFDAAVPEEITDSIEAGYCGGRLRLARSFHRIGGEYLVNGVMGVSGTTVYRLGRAGMHERMGT